MFVMKNVPTGLLDDDMPQVDTCLGVPNQWRKQSECGQLDIFVISILKFSHVLKR